MPGLSDLSGSRHEIWDENRLPLQVKMGKEGSTPIYLPQVLVERNHYLSYKETPQGPNGGIPPSRKHTVDSSPQSPLARGKFS